jgi:3D-(3,5/4)-trihydroxycyclohexane-1,2-dione acylhydrolase (decyclizing)
MVHTAAAFAKMSNRLRALVCTTSIGPGATNMLTGAAGATINRLPVLLLPGDIFARRNVRPVLQQLESSSAQDVSMNDCFRPVSRYWDRIQRPQQILTALPEAMRGLTSPAETGRLPWLYRKTCRQKPSISRRNSLRGAPRVVPRFRADAALVAEAVEWIGSAKKPFIIAGGEVIYSCATEALSRFATQTGIYRVGNPGRQGFSRL